MRARRLGAALLGALAVAGCDLLMTDPAPPPATVEVSFQIVPEPEVVGGPATAFSKIRRVLLRFARPDDTTRDTILAVTPVDGRIRLPVALPVPDRIDALGIEASLGVGTEALFEGFTVVDIVPGEPTRVNVDIVPVPRRVAPDRPALAIPNVGDVVPLSSAVLFATGDTITGLSGSWLSENPQVIDVTPDGVATAFSLGQTRLEVRYGILAETIVAGTSPVDAIEVTPSSVTVAVGQSVQLDAVLLDALGNVLLGRPVSWAVADPAVARAEPTGLVFGVAPGSTTVMVTSESATTLVPVTVF